MKRLANKTTGIINFSDYKHFRFKLLYCIIIFILFLAVIVAVLPIFWLFITSFKSIDEINSINYTFFPKNFNLKKLYDVWEFANLGKYMLNSLIVCAGAIVCSVLFNGLLAYVVAVLKPKGYKIVHGAVLLSYMIPSIVGIIPLFMNITNLNMTDSWLPLMLCFGANAYYYINFKNYFDNLPKALFEAAELDGCSDFKMFFKIILPLSKPIIGVIAIFTMTAAWSDFLLPYLVLGAGYDDSKYTLMVKIYSIGNTLGSGNFTKDQFLMLLTLTIIPQIAVFLIFQKQITGSVATTGMKD